MSGITVDLRQFKGFTKLFEKYEDTMGAELSDAARGGALLIHERVKLQIRGGPARTGKKRTRKESRTKTGAFAKSSAPGEYPKARSGDLHRSATWTHTTGRLSAKVTIGGGNVDYAKKLEDNRRPHLTRAAGELEPKIVKLVNRAVSTSIRKSRL